MDLSTVRFLPKRLEAPVGVAEKWNPRLDKLFGPGRFRFVYGASMLICEHGSWRMKYPDVNQPNTTVIHYTLHTPEGGVEVDSAESRDWPEHLQQFERSILTPIAYREQAGVEQWILEGFIGERADAGDPENIWSEIARLATRKGEYREPEESDLDQLKKVVRKQAEDPVLRDVRWESGKDYRVASARLDATERADAARQAELNGRIPDDAAKYGEDGVKRAGRTIFTP